MSYDAGDVIVVPFPFTDLSSDKQRPALVLTPQAYNSQRPDSLLAYVTSVPQSDPYSVAVTGEDLISGELVKDSWIRADKVFTLEQTRIRKRVARLSKGKLDEVRTAMVELLRGQRVPEQ